MSRDLCLIIASIFAPIRGGSATVYESLARLGGANKTAVLASWRHYGTGEPIAGWREHDAVCGYPVTRTELLRPVVMPPPANRLVSAWRVVAIDLPLKVRVAWQAIGLARRYPVGVVCIGELVSGAWLGEFLRRWFGLKLVFYVHGEEITTRYASGSFGSRRAYSLRRADAVVAVSRFTAKALEQEMGVAPDRIVLIPNGVDLTRFSPGADDGVLRARFSLGSGPIVLCVGRLVARKGFDQTVRAWSVVQAAVPEARLLIVGEGEMAVELERLAVEGGVRDRVCLAGPLSDADLLRAYRAASVFVMPNRTMPDGDTEGFGLVFLEANACGRAVIGGQAGGAVEAVVDGETGLLVDGYDSAAVATAIIRVLTDAELRQRLEAGGLAYALRNDSAARAKTFRTMCQRLCGTLPA